MEEVIKSCREQPLPPLPALKADFCPEGLAASPKKLVGLVGAQEKPSFNIGRIAAKQSAVPGTNIDGKSCRRAKTEPLRPRFGACRFGRKIL
jgi:hypothetical protein